MRYVSYKAYRSLHASTWTAGPYIGLGTGAASMLTREGYDKLCTIHTSLPQPPKNAFRVRLKVCDTRQSIAGGKTLADTSFDVEFLDVREAAAEDLMLGARLTQGLSPSLIAYAQEVLGKERVDLVLERCVHDGLLARTAAGALAPTESGEKTIVYTTLQHQINPLFSKNFLRIRYQRRR